MKLTVKKFASKDTNVIVPIFLNRPNFGYIALFRCPKLTKLLGAIKKHHLDYGFYLVNYPLTVGSTIDEFVSSINPDYHTEESISYFKDKISPEMKISQGLLIEAASDEVIDISNVLPDAKPTKEWLYIDLNPLRDREGEPDKDPSIICSLHGLNLSSPLKKRSIKI